MKIYVIVGWMWSGGRVHPKAFKTEPEAEAECKKLSVHEEREGDLLRGVLKENFEDINWRVHEVEVEGVK